MSDRCHNCPDIKYKYCLAPNVIINGKYCCDSDDKPKPACDHCGEPLELGHFAYEPNWHEFWCEECLREMLKETE